MSHSRQTVFRLFSCSQSAEWCFHSHLNTTATIVGACLWVDVHARVCTISNSPHWNGTLARPTASFFFVFFLSNGKHVDDDDKCQQHPHMKPLHGSAHFNMHVSTYLCSKLLIYTFTLDTFSLFVWNYYQMMISLKQQKQKKLWKDVSRWRVLTVVSMLSPSLSLHLPAPHTVYELIYYTSPAIRQMALWDRDRKCRQLYNLFLIWLCWGSSTASCSNCLETDSFQGPAHNLNIFAATCLTDLWLLMGRGEFRAELNRDETKYAS